MGGRMLVAIMVCAIGCASGTDPLSPRPRAQDSGASSGDDAGSGCATLGCPTGLECVGGTCVPEPVDACRAVMCPADAVCVDGSCVGGVDPCDAVVCLAAERCVGGTCVPGSADGDRDGFPASADCDDADPAVHPGAPERCNLIDDDCDVGVDEGLPLTLTSLEVIGAARSDRELELVYDACGGGPGSLSLGVEVHGADWYTVTRVVPRAEPGVHRTARVPGLCGAGTGTLRASTAGAEVTAPLTFGGGPAQLCAWQIQGAAGASGTGTCTADRGCSGRVDATACTFDVVQSFVIQGASGVTVCGAASCDEPCGVFGASTSIGEVSTTLSNTSGPVSGRWSVRQGASAACLDGVPYSFPDCTWG